MKNWVWWPKMHKWCQPIYFSCANVMPQNFALSNVSGVLSSLHQLDLLFLGFVGPRIWRGNSHYYIVGNGHCFQFVMSSVCMSFFSRMLRSRWFSVFSTLLVVLVDRVLPFISSKCRTLATDVLRAHLVFTLHYAQGNSINKECHFSLERKIESARLSSRLLQAVTLVHKSTSSLAIRQSLFFIFFDLEPAFLERQLLRLGVISALCWLMGCILLVFV